MKKIILLLTLGLCAGYFLYAKGYQPGDKAVSFTLKDVDGHMVSLYDYGSVKGFIVVFTCNTCPYAKAYEDRIIALDKKFKPLGFPVIAINSNDPDISPGDSYAKMKERASEKGFTFPYLFDENQEVLRKYGATNTPHIYVLQKKNDNLIVRYVGAIDNNYRDAAAATKHYVEDAIASLLDGKNTDPDFTKAIGCAIKVKR